MSKKFKHVLQNDPYTIGGEWVPGTVTVIITDSATPENAEHYDHVKTEAVPASMPNSARNEDFHYPYSY